MTDAAKKVEKNLEDLEHSPGPYVDYLLKGVPFGQTEPLIKAAFFCAQNSSDGIAVRERRMHETHQQPHGWQEGGGKKMTGNYEKTLQKLEQAEAKLQKIADKKKDLEAERKSLLERAETERLSSRGLILESFLKEPLVLTNEDIKTLLGLMFRSSFSKETLDKMIRKRKGEVQENIPDLPDDPA